MRKLPRDRERERDREIERERERGDRRRRGGERGHTTYHKSAARGDLARQGHHGEGEVAHKVEDGCGGRGGGGGVGLNLVPVADRRRPIAALCVCA